MKKFWIWAIAVLALALLAFVIFIIIRLHKPTYPNQEIQEECSTNPLMVERVIDGDTFLLCSGDTVRLLCVDTPEKKQEGYQEAKLFLENLILYKQIELQESNYNGPDKDKYKRLLRWVYIQDDSGNKILVNKYLLEEGYGDILIIPPETCNEVAD